MANETAGATTEDARTAEQIQQESLNHLGPYVMNSWRQAALHRRQSGISERLLNCLRDIKGEYSADEREKILALRQPLVFVRNAFAKRNTCNAIIRQVFLESADPAYVLNSTPVPEISEVDAAALAESVLEDWSDYQVMKFVGQGVPPDQAEAMVYDYPPDPMVVAEYARARRDEIDNKRNEESQRKVDRMSKKIQDQTKEGLWLESFMTAVDYASTYGTCVLKGPIRRNRKRIHFQNGEAKLSSTDVLEWEAVNPFDCYPVKGASKISHGDFHQRVRFTPRELVSMAKMGTDNGYFPDAINRILALHPNGGLTLVEPEDSERKRLEGDGTIGVTQNTQIEGIESWCDVRGSMLIEQGITETTDGKTVDAEDYYETNTVVIDNEVVFCTLTDEKLGRPLYKGVFYSVPNSWWGESPVEVMRDLARGYNATYRFQRINAAVSSGPRQFINIAKVVAGQSYEMTPHSTLLWNDPTGTGQPPVRIDQAKSYMPELWADLAALAKLFDTVTGIPSNSHADDTAASAGRTYNGLLLIMTAAKQGANDVIFSLFTDVMKPALTYLYRYNMLFSDDPEIKGDCEVDAGGLLAILVREQSKNDLAEFMNLAGQPAVQAVIGESGMAEIVRQYIKLMQGFNPDKVVPSEEERERRKQMEALRQQVAMYEQQGMAARAPSGNRFGSPTVAPQTAGSVNGQAGRPSVLPRVPMEVV